MPSEGVKLAEKNLAGVRKGVDDLLTLCSDKQESTKNAQKIGLFNILVG
jgi:hypothetical protein